MNLFKYLSLYINTCHTPPHNITSIEFLHYYYSSSFKITKKREKKTMPGVGIPIGGGNKEYPGNLTPFVLVTCIVAAMGGLIFGYDIGISGTN
jgi:hypothetical protein